MIRLIPVTEDNWMEIASLTVKEHQRNYVAPAIGILARGYVYRDCNVKIYAFEADGIIVGTALVREFTDEPLGYAFSSSWSISDIRTEDTVPGLFISSWTSCGKKATTIMWNSV